MIEQSEAALLPVITREETSDIFFRCRPIGSPYYCIQLFKVPFRCDLEFLSNTRPVLS